MCWPESSKVCREMECQVLVRCKVNERIQHCKALQIEHHVLVISINICSIDDTHIRNFDCSDEMHEVFQHLVMFVGFWPGAPQTSQGDREINSTECLPFVSFEFSPLDIAWVLGRLLKPRRKSDEFHVITNSLEGVLPQYCRGAVYSFIVCLGP